MDTVFLILRFELLFALLIVVQHLLFRQSVYLVFHRVYLLLAPVVALLVAVIARMDLGGALYTVRLPVFGSEQAAPLATGGSLDPFSILVMIWSVGMVVHAFLFARRISRMHKMIEDAQSPVSCTFLRRIYIAADLDAEVREKVRLHEQVHADQLHSADLIWYGLWRIVFWYDPFFILGRTSLKHVHEYIADRETDSLTSHYSETLLASAFGLARLPMANEFRSLNVKNRIDMLKKKNNSTQRSRLVIGLLIATIVTTAFACTEAATEIPGGHLYTEVDEMPRFPGCEEGEMSIDDRKDCAMGKLVSYLGSELTYPKGAEAADESGVVAVQFIIDREGKVVSPEVTRSQGVLLDAEALRVVSALPDWIPGRKDGDRVNVQMILPMKFVLE